MEDIKVVEFATVLAGPAVGMFFAEMGAQVIKIENINSGGDITRQWKLPVEDSTSDTSAYFASVNYLKEHLFVDLKDTRQLSKVMEYLKEADIVISNWKMGDAEKYGLDYASLKKINAQIIYGAILGYHEFPERIAYDVILQAETGWISMNGINSNHLCKVPIAIIDLFAAHQLKEGILYALYQREKFGKGAKVSVSLFDAAIASLANQASNYLMTQSIPKPVGTLHPNIAPYGEIFETFDHKNIILAIGSDEQFIALCKLLNIEILMAHENYNSNQNRVKFRQPLQMILSDKIKLFKASEFLQSCIKLKIPAGIIRNLEALFELPETKHLILTDAIGKRVRSKVFKIEST